MISQWRAHNRNITFFGDDTWTRLFPGQFLRQDPVTSFFVSDYTEVDDNVTRHLEAELAREDWDVMILHYLGLDHIGHLQGPASALVPAKLQQMGEVIQLVWSRLRGRARAGLPPMLVVLGDHGMADGGGHGGSSAAEVRVPCVVISDQLPDTAAPDTETEALQVDLAPSLALVTGVPVPGRSVGTLLASLAAPGPCPDQRDTARHNAEHLQRLLAASGSSSRGSEVLEAARGMGADTEAECELAVAMYREAARQLQASLVGRASNYDLYQMHLAMGLMVLLLASSLLTPVPVSPSSLLHLSSLYTSLAGLCCHLLVCSELSPSSSLCSLHLATIAKLGLSLLVIVMAVSTVTAASRASLGLASVIVTTKPLSVSSGAIVLGAIGAIVSLCSSSFIEEEHQTHYFLFVTLLFLILIENYSSISGNIFAVMFLHRLLRNFHQTGDKWKHLPDLEDELLKPEQKTRREALFLAAMLALLLKMSVPSKTMVRIRNLVLFTSIYTQKKIIKSTLVEQFCFLLIFSSMFVSKKSSQEILHETFLFLALLLHSDVNIILIAILVLQLKLLLPVLGNIPEPFRSLATLLVMKVAFFYLGNSNSLASIQVGAAYTGVASFHPVTVTSLLALHTYTGPLLVASLPSPHTSSSQLVSVLLLYTLTEMTLFCAISTAMRHHLFVWTVFSPKLLYLGMNLIVYSTISTLLLTVNK